MWWQCEQTSDLCAFPINGNRTNVSTVTVDRKSVGGLTPEFVIVGTAACLSAAVSGRTQVTRTVVDSGTVLGADYRLATRTPVRLHHLVDKTAHRNDATVEIMWNAEGKWLLSQWFSLYNIILSQGPFISFFPPLELFPLYILGLQCIISICKYL